MATLYFDGASRGNPGDAAIGYVLELANRTITNGEAIGTATNNEAEYAALIAGLRRARNLEVTGLTVKGDSELVIKQVTGEYAVSASNLKTYHTEVDTLAREFDRLQFNHIPREKNNRADELTEEILGER